MPITVSDVNELKVYIEGVMDRANHHAKNVQGIALALAGAVVWKKDTDTPIKVRTYGRSTANVLWVEMAGNSYAFSYNHAAGAIEMRQGSTQGAVLHSFSDATSVAQVEQIFRSL
jgi:Integron cassette protein VCH_CASS1 chain